MMIPKVGMHKTLVNTEEDAFDLGVVRDDELQLKRRVHQEEVGRPFGQSTQHKERPMSEMPQSKVQFGWSVGGRVGSEQCRLSLSSTLWRRPSPSD